MPTDLNPWNTNRPKIGKINMSAAWYIHRTFISVYLRAAMSKVKGRRKNPPNGRSNRTL